MNPRSEAPTGRFHASPGHRPGSTVINESSPEGAEQWDRIVHGVRTLLGRPFRAWENGMHRFPGRCPGLVWGCPFGARKGAQP